MVDKIECQKCKGFALAVMATCMCDLDFCTGQRCGANEIIHHYECLKCGWTSEITKEGKQYDEYHTPKA